VLNQSAKSVAHVRNPANVGPFFYLSLVAAAIFDWILYGIGAECRDFSRRRAYSLFVSDHSIRHAFATKSQSSWLIKPQRARSAHPPGPIDLHKKNGQAQLFIPMECSLYFRGGEGDWSIH
jgi:hypothetical protein